MQRASNFATIYKAVSLYYEHRFILLVPWRSIILILVETIRIFVWYVMKAESGHLSMTIRYITALVAIQRYVFCLINVAGKRKTIASFICPKRLH